MKQEQVIELWEANAEVWTTCVRAGFDVYRDGLNTPSFLAILPSIYGLSGLDVGCGEGANTRHLARLGATMHGVDIAPTFIRHSREAEQTEPLGITYQLGDALALPFDDGAFDFVSAFMSLMDVPDPDKAVQEAARVLRPGGFLQFSILHPCFTPPHRKVLRDAEGKPYAIEVGGYFDNVDGRVETWIFAMIPREERVKLTPFRVPRFHRTLSQWVEILCNAGLTIEQFAEPTIDEETARRVPYLADTRPGPMSLLVRARKRDAVSLP